MRAFILASVLLLSGCSLLPGHEDPDVPKSRCDEFASQAVQTDDLQEAKNLAARASECYAALQNQ